jgi:hypothetical protein
MVNPAYYLMFIKVFPDEPTVNRDFLVMTERKIKIFANKGLNRQNSEYS